MLVFKFCGYNTLLPTPLSHAHLSLWVGGYTGCSDHKMPVVAYWVMFQANNDLFAGTPLVGFINTLDPVFSQKNDLLVILDVQFRGYTTLFQPRKELFGSKIACCKVSCLKNLSLLGKKYYYHNLSRPKCFTVYMVCKIQFNGCGYR